MTETINESIYEMMNPTNRITEEDLNNLCYHFLELLELSLSMQWKFHQQAETTGNIELKIYEEGCDKIISKIHHDFLELKKKYQWDSNIGEELK